MFHDAVCQRLEKLPYRLPVKFDPDSFLQRLAGDPRIQHLSSQDICTAFDHVMTERAQLGHALPESGAENVVSLGRAREVKHTDFNKITADEIISAHKQHGKPRVVQQMLEQGPAKPVQNPRSNIVHPELRKSGFASRLSTEAKIYGGISLLMAGLSAVGAFNNFSHAVGKDETGHTQIHWSNVGLGLVSAALAAGTAYVAHQQLRAPAHGV